MEFLNQPVGEFFQSLFTMDWVKITVLIVLYYATFGLWLTKIIASNISASDLKNVGGKFYALPLLWILSPFLGALVLIGAFIEYPIIRGWEAVAYLLLPKEKRDLYKEFREENK